MMIQPHELRIGNYYKGGIEINGSREAKIRFFDSERTFKLSLEHFQAFVNAPMIVEMIEPIPLNEEWLLRLGFIKGKEYWLSPNESSEEGFIDSMCFDFEGLDFIITSSEYSSKVVKCEYVHILQNLYWCLCEKELEIIT